MRNLSQIETSAALQMERCQAIGDGHICRYIQSVRNGDLPAPFRTEINHPAVAELTPQSVTRSSCCYHEVVPCSCRHTHNCTDFLRACNSRFVSIRFEEAMKYTCLPLLFTLACSMAGGDTLILKDGQKIEGRYLSSTDSAVQFEVNGKPFTYSTWLIRELRFHSGASRRQLRPGVQGPPRKRTAGSILHRVEELHSGPEQSLGRGQSHPASRDASAGSLEL